MKKSMLTIYALILLMVASSSYVFAFEGIIHQKTTTKSSNPDMMMDAIENLPEEQRAQLEQMLEQQMQNGTGEATLEETQSKIFISKDQFRVESIGTENTTILFNSTKNEITIIDESEQSYMVMNIDAMQKNIEMMRQQIAQMSPPPPQAKPEKNKTKFQKTGATKTINGYSCNQFIYKTDESTTEYWITTQLPLKETMGELLEYANLLDGISEMGNNDQDAEIEQLKTINGIPILTIIKSKEYEQTDEIIKIETKSIDKSLFIVPAGYQKNEIPQFGM